MLIDMYPAATHALLSFSLSCIVFIVSLFSSSVLGFTSELWALTYWGPGLYFCLLNFILRYSLKGFTYDVAVRSAFLGSTFATGFYFATFDNSFHIFGLYAMAFSMFHFSEFLSVALTNPRTLTVDSFILNHSMQYWVAAAASWIEAVIENYFFPEMKTTFWLSHIGVIMCVVGEVMRKVAMFTAKTNFNHNVQTVKRSDHQLVTHGVYFICRHPSYVGWFYWSIGTQIILLNPICVVIYTLVTWSFFRERIFTEEMFLISFFGSQYLNYQKKIILLNPICVVIYTLVTWSFFRERIFTEEMFLISFFGSQYLNYQKKVGTGLPFIRGYIPDVNGGW